MTSQVRGASRSKGGATRAGTVLGGLFRPRTGAAATLLVAVVCCPVLFVLWQATTADQRTWTRLLGRPLIPGLLWNTATLTVAVTAVSMIAGLGTAFLIDRTDLPGKRFWTIVLAMPLAIPEFVHGYGWVSLFPTVQGFWGAVLVMSTSLYPLVFLPALAVLRHGDASLDEAAQSLGVRGWGVFLRVTLPITRPALAGGALLVALYMLGEYGAFAMLRFTTFATAIYTQIETAYDTTSAALLSVILIALAAFVLVLEARTGGARLLSHGGRTRRSVPLLALRWWKAPALLSLVFITTLSVGVPLFSLAYWLLRGSSTTLPQSSVWQALLTTVGFAAAAATVSTLAAVPVALYTWRSGSRFAMALERAAYLTRSLPGVAVALALVFFAIRVAQPFYQQPPLLILGYAVLFFPLALTGVRSSLSQLPRSLEEAASALGENRLGVLVRVTLPLAVPGIAASFAMVALTASTELTATLILRPTGTETLATLFWKDTTSLAWGAAAPYALAMVALSVPAVLLLTRGFLVSPDTSRKDS